MTRDEIVDLFDRRLNAFNDHDVESIAEAYAEDAVVESPLGGTHQGRAAIAAVLGSFLSAFSDAGESHVQVARTRGFAFAKPPRWNPAVLQKMSVALGAVNVTARPSICCASSSSGG